ncbi:hypothetical protein PIB30_008910 [Stylosanthes scabra]|uniref:Uncharacterized protein n=1 Tax=Stylosanthes scabra TaxID=79078 RepID=A0ABU6Q4Z7_9FABA|nr:hypothetical protein [Stylosanthes scabra]
MDNNSINKTRVNYKEEHTQMMKKRQTKSIVVILLLVEPHPVHISSHRRRRSSRATVASSRQTCEHCRRRHSTASKSLVAVLKVEEVSAVVVSAPRPSHSTSHPITVAVAVAAAPSYPSPRLPSSSSKSLQAVVFVFHLRLQAFVSAVHGLQSLLDRVIIECRTQDLDESMPFALSLASLLQELGSFSKQLVTLSPQKVMITMAHYIPNFNVTNQR